jgi:hypothetical protein
MKKKKKKIKEPVCYYNKDGGCRGQVFEVGGFKKHLCYRCNLEEESFNDDPVKEKYND